MTDRCSEFPEGLGCLVESARSLGFKSFNHWSSLILLLVGVFSVGYHAYHYTWSEQNNKRKLEEKIGFSYANNPDVQKYIKRKTNMETAMHAGGIGIGLIFLILALLVSPAPIACNTLGLSLYVADWLMWIVYIFLYDDPLSGNQEVSFNDKIIDGIFSTCINIAVVIVFIVCIKRYIEYLKGLKKIGETDDTETGIVEVAPST